MLELWLLLYFTVSPLPVQFILSPDLVIATLSLPFPTFTPSPSPPAHLLSGAVLSQYEAGVLLHNEFCVHVFEMVRSAEEGVFITVYIVSCVPGQKGE